jgi:hypothetical protein
MALRYFRSTGTNWGNVGDWSSSPSPIYTAVAAIPAAVDDVIFEAASANCTLNVAGTCLSFNASTYGAKTWALGTNNISVGAGVFTLGTGMTVTGTGTLIKAGAGTFTSNGVTWSGSVQTTINTTYTWGDAWTIAGSFTSSNNATFNGAFNITIGGSFTHPNLTSTLTTYILNGTGSLNGVIVAAATIINTAPTNTITLPTSLLISGGILRLTSGIVSVTAGHIFQPAACTLDTDRTSTGGNKISFYNYTSFNSGTITLQSNLTITNNFTNANNITTAGVFNIYVGGNYAQTGTIGGTATLILDGTANATIGTGSIGIDLTINKSGSGVVTPSATMIWGAANKTLTINSNVNFATNSNTLTLSGTPLTINNTSGLSISFYNLTVPAATTLNINGATMLVAGTLLCSGSATFAGAFGWTAQNFTCTLASSTITLQNINANPSAEYKVNGVLTLLGTAANRITLQAAGSATFNATIIPVAQLNYLTGVAPAIGMTLSQEILASPAQLDPTNRPVITGGASPTFAITPAAGAIIGSSLSMRAGYKAKFTLTNGTGSQNVGFTTTQDIDSSGGITITSFNSYGDSIGQPSANLFRTLNWGPLIAPSGSVYYTFVN